MSYKNLGPLYILIAALLWSLAGLGIKYIAWHPLSIACVRGTFAALTIIVLRRKAVMKLTRATIITALCMNATIIMFMFANKLTTAANAVVLQYTAPVYVIIFSMIILKTRPRLLEIVAVLMIFGGIALFFIDHFSKGVLLGDILALLSGVTFSGVFFFNTLPDANPSDASVLGCSMLAVLIPFLFFDPQVANGGAFPWIVAISLGVFQFGIAYYFFSKGIQSTGAVASSIICTLEPIFNPIWVFLALGEKPGNLSIIGAVIVIATVCLYNVVNSFTDPSRAK